VKTNLAGGLLVLVAACSDSTSPSSPPAVTIAPIANWSGGEVTLTSAAFATAALPVLVVGAETLSVHRTGDSSVAAALPLGPSGPVTIQLAQGHRRHDLGTVQRVGYREYRDLAPGFYGELVTTRRAGTPIVVGTTVPTLNGNGVVQYLDLGSMAVTPVPGLYGSSYYGVSPTYRPDQFVLLDAAGTTAVWQLWPTVTQVDTTPHFGLPIRHIARLSDSVWLHTGHHYTQAYVNDSAVFGGYQGLPTESVWSVFISPTGGTATVAVAQGTPGVPVFNSTSGDTLYTLGAAFRQAGWAAYSQDGASIYVLAGATSKDSLIRVDAATGAVVAGLPLTFPTMNVATDPVEPLVYVEALLADGTPTILVLEATTLAEVGRLTSPALAGGPSCYTTCFEGAMAVDRTRNRLHVVWIDPRLGITTSPIWTFDLLP